MTNTISINDRLGPGGLENVATLSTDANGNTVLVGENYITHPLGISIARVGISNNWTVPPLNAANKTEWNAGLILNTTGSADVWSAATPSRLFVPAGFKLARVTSQLSLSNAFSGQSYKNHISKGTTATLTYTGVGLETGIQIPAGELNITAQTGWMDVSGDAGTADGFFETFVLNSHTNTANTILGTNMSWFQIELMR